MSMLNVLLSAITSHMKIQKDYAIGIRLYHKIKHSLQIYCIMEDET